MSEVSSLKSFCLDPIKIQRKEIKRKHHIDLQIAIDNNKKDYEEKLIDLEEIHDIEIQELRYKLNQAINNEKRAKKRLKKEMTVNNNSIVGNFKELERKRLEEYDGDEVMQVLSESSSSSSWITCKNCYIPFDKNIKRPLKCEQLQPNLGQCPHAEEDRACGCDISRCKTCNIPVCSNCENLHKLLCVCRCGMWLDEGMSDRGNMPIPDSAAKPASCRRLLPVWYEKPGKFNDTEKFIVNHHETGETTCGFCDVVFCDECFEIHEEFTGSSSERCFKQLSGRFLSAIADVKRSLPNFRSQQLQSLKHCLEGDFESSDDDNNDDDNDDDDDDDDNEDGDNN